MSDAAIAGREATESRAKTDAMIFMDTLDHYVYSPLDVNYRFALDLDGDGIKDSMPQYPWVPYNNARPTVHNKGANVILLDGHAERVAFKKLWEMNRAGNPIHSYWYLED